VRKTAQFLSATLLLAGFWFVTPDFCFADSFNPGDQIVATFTAAPNTADLLFFFNNDPLTVTGAPVLTLTLYNGASSLGAIVAPPFTSGGQNLFQGGFLSPTSPLVDPAPHTTVDFTSINNGTIAGTLVWTISGGSLSGFATSDFILYDAKNCGSLCFVPEFDISSQIKLQTATEPSSLLLLGAGMMLVVLAAARMKS
jgi:hypothetical protein